DAREVAPSINPQAARASTSFRIGRLLFFQERDRSLDSLRRLDQRVGRVAFANPFEEELRANHTRLIEDKSARMGYALRLASGGLVADVERVDRLAPGIGEQREGDLHAVGELLQDLRVIVADADELDSCVFDGLEVALQLDQLRAAEGS